MILVDTSIWIDHLRAGDRQLEAMLEEGEVLAHPFVIGEVALGNLRHRERVISNLHQLPRVMVATDEEVLELIGRRRLYGLGIGYVDAHLLAAARITPETSLWTRDMRLARAVSQLGMLPHQ